jgi:hypothetical protein
MDVLRERNADEPVRGEYGAQEERGLDGWRDQVEQALGEQADNRVLARESANAYADFLDSLFIYYRESSRIAERDTGER